MDIMQTLIDGSVASSRTDTGSSEGKSSALVLGGVLEFLHRLCEAEAQARDEVRDFKGQDEVESEASDVEEDEVQAAEAGEEGASDATGASTETTEEANHEEQAEQGRMSPSLEYYFRRRRDGLNEEQVAEWEELVAEIESFGITMDADLKFSPVILLHFPARLVKLTMLLNEITIHAEEESTTSDESSNHGSSGDESSGGESPGNGPSDDGASSVVSGFAPAFSTPPEQATEPFPPYSEECAQYVAAHPDPSPFDIQFRGPSPSNNTASIPKPATSITLGPETYIGLTRHSVPVPGVHVNIADVQGDGSNLVQLDGSMWLKLRVIRELPRGVTLPTPGPSPLVPSQLGPSPKFLSPLFSSPRPGSPSRRNISPYAPMLQGAGLGLRNLGGGGFMQQQVGLEPRSADIMGDHYNMIPEGMMKGSYVCRKGVFMFGGTEWVKEFVVVPAEI